MKRFVIIVAGGKGLRMGDDLPKQFIPFNGKPILMHTLEKFHRWNPEAEIMLVLPVDHQDYWRMLCIELGCKIPHRIANGGKTRFHSVQNALETLRPEIDQPHVKDEAEFYDYYLHGDKKCVAIHDGVRPFVSAEVIDACFRAADKYGSAIPVVPLVDSIRKTDGKTSYPVDRNQYMSVQTPQVFWGVNILEAYKRASGTDFTDDASVAEAAEYPVTTVAGNRENIKITTAFDLVVAKALFQQENESR